MSLTLPKGPLAARRPKTANFTLDGPEQLLFCHEFPRRVRAELAGHTVLDTRAGRLLHESGQMPVLYVPEEDLATDLLEPTDHRTHCPVKGDAAYWTVRADGRVAENAVWAYPDPVPEARWLRGLRAVVWEAMDAWYDEEEQVHGHLRDPYHRVDVRATSRPVTVRRDGEVVASSTRAMLLSETGLPNRYYLPREDVRTDLAPTDTRAVCPYKGTSHYFSVAGLDDAAWTYPEPLEDASKVAGRVCFLHDDLAVELG